MKNYFIDIVFTFLIFSQVGYKYGDCLDNNHFNLENYLMGTFYLPNFIHNKQIKDVYNYTLISLHTKPVFIFSIHSIIKIHIVLNQRFSNCGTQKIT